MVTCAIYARVSDESQAKGDSIQHQISYCKEHARRKSLDESKRWVTPEALIFVDEGITGTSMVKRPSVQRLLRHARSRSFDVILFKGISRFARDTVDALVMLRTLTACGVRVISMEENFDSLHDNAEFVFTIHSALAQAESEKTAIRVRVGAAEKAKLGRWNGQPPLGYTLNQKTKRLEIDNSVAPTIKDIFSMYVTGMGVRRIADALNRSGRFTKNGKLWTQRNISRLLQNPVYMGDVVYGRRETRVSFMNESDPLARHKREVWVNDPQRLVTCEKAHPEIISRQLFQTVQELMGRRRQTSGPTKHRYLLTKGLLLCACGGSMTITYNGAGTAYYRCQRQRDAGKAACNMGYLRARDVEEIVLNRLRTDVIALVDFNQLQSPEQPFAMEEELQNVDASLNKEFKKSLRLFDQYVEGCLLDEQYFALNNDLKMRIASLQATRTALLNQLPRCATSAGTNLLVQEALMRFLSVKTANPTLTREVVTLFLEHVKVIRDVNGTKELCLKYRFENVLQESNVVDV